MKIDQKPNLFIVGAPKAGTTFLFDELQNHPELFFPRIKELNYFSFDILKKESYYRDFKIEDLKSYLNFYKRHNNKKYLVDPSVSYFAYSKVPQLIYEFNPDSKIIMILRSPIKRAFSHYQMDKRMGYANKSLNEYISKKDQNPHFVQYIQNSLYYSNISNYLKYFKSENICILILENIEDEINNLYHFLEIKKLDNGFSSEKKSNENKIPRNNISKYMQKNRNIVSIMKMFIPKRLSDYFKKYFYKKAPEEIIDQTTYDIMFNYFKKDIERLSVLLNKDFFEIWNIKTLKE